MEPKNENDDVNLEECLHPEQSIEIVRLASDGAGVGYLNGKAVFVPGMLPGEKGTVRITEEKKSYQRADVAKIINPSPQRQAPPCSVYSSCGGCDLQHINYAYSLEWKRLWVKDALVRIGGIQDVAVEPVIGMDDPWRYRNKAVLHRDQEGRLGYYKEKTKEVIQFDDCLLLSKNINQRIRKLRDILGKDYPGIKTAALRESNRGKGLLLLEGNTKDEVEIESLIRELKEEGTFSPHICSIAIPTNSQDFAGSGPQYLNEHMDDLRFRVSPRAFLQVNSVQTKKIYGIVLDWAGLTGKEEVWDLYCGIGTISLMLAKRAKHVTGIEENPAAVEDAALNVRDNKISNVTLIQGKVEEKVKGLSQIPDLAVTDPPRAGMEPSVIKRILEIKPPKIIYVSCDPATLARDLKILLANDKGTEESYILKKVQPVDMFPWTRHVESIIMMTYSGSKG
ncbi:MAG: 23S rRNA (uracil-C(5))-methyltransferase RlmCD [Candidatus Dichloromethanomonas elyunquensis]|nr:MAG: 23S rRNA (uracil-C(5))-methyltransferase RlmCD [Candidatus Dichloromethanomonas elyunquensis]